MKRYAIYYAPRRGPFQSRAAKWLGWDVEAGLPVAQPVLDGLPRPMSALTDAPRAYGFHGTIRAPFRLADGQSVQRLEDAVSAFASGHKAVSCGPLHLVNLDGFIALTPSDGKTAIAGLGAAVVEATEPFRAALTEAEIARRRPGLLTRSQRDLLMRWGYPFVMEEFRFHLTLTGRLDPAEADPVRSVLERHFSPVLPDPFVIEDLCLVGEDDAGRFHLRSRHALAG